MNHSFTEICQMSQTALKFYVANRLKETYEDVTVGDGFVYAQGKYPVLLVAHLDTVHETEPVIIYYDENKDALFSPTGIGGDDRCGVYMIFEVLKKFNCSVLFCEDEEEGTVGAKKFIKTDLAKELKFNYMIEFDRKGSNDAVFYDCANEDFEKFITKEFYETSWGSFSDISVLAPFIGCAAVNLSCGYYNAHTKTEYVVISEMAESIEAACKILERTTEEDKFEYIESPYSYSGWNSESWKKYFDAKYGNGSYYSGCGYYGGDWGYYGEDTYDICDSPFPTDADDFVETDGTYYFLIEYVTIKGSTEWEELYANSEPEAVGKFLMRNPDLAYNDIIDICSDKTSFA